MFTDKKTLVIMPAYNEASCIGDVIDNIKKQAPFADIVVIDDGSVDNTALIAKSKGVVVLSLPYNMGIGGAVQTGYQYAEEKGYDIAVQIDSDGQHPVGEIPTLVKTIVNDKVDMVIGSRYIQMNDREPLLTRAVGKWILSKALTFFTRQKITDSSSGFRAINRNVIELFSKYYPRDYPEPESIAFLIREGFKVKEVPVIMNIRIAGQSSISMLTGLYYVIKVILAIFVDQFEKKITYKGAII